MVGISSDKSAPVVIFNDTRVDRHHGCKRVMETLIEQLILVGCKTVGTVDAHTRWRDNQNILKLIEKSKLVIINGEGTLHHSNPEGLWLLEAGEYANSLGIPSVLLNCTWQSNEPKFLEKLEYFNIISVRESYSLSELKKDGIECTIVPDLSLYSNNTIKKERNGIGFTDSVVRDTALSLDRYRRLNKGIYVPIQYSTKDFRGIYQFFREYIGYQDLIKPNYFINLLKIRFCHYNQQVKSEQDLLDLISSLNLLVSGRFHACTFALLTQTPFITTKTNSHKIESLISDVGLSSWRAEDCLSSEIIYEALKTGWEPGEIENIEIYINEGRHKTQELFKNIGYLL